MAKQRLQKILAAAGVDSRRNCETLIEEGVVRVNRKVVDELPAFADPEIDVITDLKQKRLICGEITCAENGVSVSHGRLLFDVFDPFLEFDQCRLVVASISGRQNQGDPLDPRLQDFFGQEANDGGLGTGPIGQSLEGQPPLVRTRSSDDGSFDF